MFPARRKARVPSYFEKRTQVKCAFVGRCYFKKDSGVSRLTLFCVVYRKCHRMERFASLESDEDIAVRSLLAQLSRRVSTFQAEKVASNTVQFA